MRWAAAVALASAVLCLSGCGSRSVHMALPSGAADPACASVGAALPHTLLGKARRATSPASPALAAWGDPAIILRCGVSAPGPSADCQSVNGVDWIVSQLSNGTSFTTYNRMPAIQVLVPSHYAPEAFALTGLTQAVSRIPAGPSPCT